MSAKKSRTTYNQLATMVNYLEQNKELLLNKGSKKNSEKWTELCNILNCSGKGPIKSTKEWKRVLIEWKYNTKRRLKTNSNGKRLSNAEERLLKLLSEIPNEDIDPSEIQFVQVLVEENNNETHEETVKIELVEEEIKKEIHFKEDGEGKYLNVTEEIEQNSNLPSTSNSVFNQLQATEQSKDVSKIIATNNNYSGNIIGTCSQRPLKIKRRKLKQPFNVSRNKVRRNIDVNTKSYNLLANAMLKLAESNFKIAESNCKIAESNQKLAEALNLYAKQI